MVRAIWIDDQVERRRNQVIIERAAKHGLFIEGFSDPDPAYKRLANDSVDVALVDLRMPGQSGIVIAERLAEIDRSVGVAFVSAYLHDSKYAGDIEHMDPTLNVVHIDKNVIQPDVNDQFVEAFVRPVIGVAEGRRAGEGREDVPQVDNSPFAMSQGTFDELEPAEQVRLSQEAYRISARWLRSIWEQSNSRYVVMCGRPDLARWVEGRKFPSEGKLREIADHNRRAVYVFSRPVEADSMRLGQWSECDESDFYPSIGLTLTARDGTSYDVEFHFDTGCPEILLSYEYFRAHEIGKIGRQVASAVRVGVGPYSYYEGAVNCIIADGMHSRSIRVDAQMVFGWDGCPFIRVCSEGLCGGSRKASAGTFLCGRRLGLIGRKLLTDTGLVVVLDGAQRRTRLG